MKYNANITNKDLVSGQLVVQVIFTSEDNSKIINDSFITRSGQDPNWLTNAIARKAKELEELDAFVDTISLGDVDTTVPQVELTPEDDAKVEFKEDLVKHNKFVQAMRLGLTDQENAEFIALQQKMKDNFSSEYLDLI